MKKRLALLVLVAGLGIGLLGCAPWVANMLPNATFTISNGADKFTFTFDGRASSDTDGTVETWGWDFGDGATAYGQLVMHIYAEYGTYIVTLVVTDNEGGENSYAVTVVIEGDAPVALFTATPHIVQTGEQIVFNATASYDPDGEIDWAEWDFGDGMTLSGWWEDVQVVGHDYDVEDDYVITLTVEDEGGLTDSVGHEVHVLEP